MIGFCCSFIRWLLICLCGCMCLIVLNLCWMMLCCVFCCCCCVERFVDGWFIMKCCLMFVGLFCWYLLLIDCYCKVMYVFFFCFCVFLVLLFCMYMD